MKTPKWILLPLLAVATTTISWYVTLNQPLSKGLAYEFKTNGLTAHTPGDRDARYSLFFSPGDGRYTITQTNPLPRDIDTTLTYAYRTSGSTYNPYLEATEIYDDGKPPKVYRIMPPGNNSATTDSDIIPLASLPNFTPTNFSTKDEYRKTLLYPIRIDPVRRIVPGCGVTYAVTFENLVPPQNTPVNPTPANGTIEFTYDNRILEPLNVKDGNTIIPSISNPGSTIPNTGSISRSFNSLKMGEQRTVFFIFKTKDGIKAEASINPVPTVKLNVDISNIDNTDDNELNNNYFWNTTSNTTDAAYSQNIVAKSHDPNYKSISPGIFCTNYNGFLTFKVEFQNDGKAAAKEVTIEDELDYLISPTTVVTDVKAYIGSKKVINNLVPSLNGRKRIFTIPTDGKLRGTKESGYGKKFLDADTRGFLEFKIPASTLDGKPHCNAVCNRAMITFDCNPPIETNIALSKIACGNCQPPFCDTCNVCQETEVFLDTTLSEQLLPQSVLNSLPKTGFYYKWYPESGVVNVNDPATLIKVFRNATYTLVASSTDSSQCKRIIYHVPYKVTCNDLVLSTTVTPPGPPSCAQSNQKFTIDASVGNYANVGNLVWNCSDDPAQICSKGVNSVKQRDMAPNLYHIAVTDVSTGCFAEKWIDLRLDTILIDDDPSNCSADLIVSGGHPPYTYEWRWDGGGHYTGGASLDLYGKTGVSVTVTDANQCTGTFKPDKCKVYSQPYYERPFVKYALFIMVLLVCLAAIYTILMKRHQ